MGRYMSDRRKKRLQYKKEDPLGMKIRFIRDFIFGEFKHYANSQLNNCGWQFEEGSYNHKLWKLYHCDLEEIEKINGYKWNEYEKKHGRFNLYPTIELRQIFLDYLHRSYDLYKRTLKLHKPMNCAQYSFYLSWFEKNFKKYDNNYEQRY